MNAGGLKNLAQKRAVREDAQMGKRALLSVSDKRGLLDFAKALVQRYGYQLLSTGGTAKMLRVGGLEVMDVSDYTGFPEMMEGRIKTLHPKIHGGLLCRRDKASHMDEAKKHGIDMIDLVVVNLYPFEATVAKADCTLEQAIENIDIGGPSMLRSAAKNHDAVTVVCDPDDYDRVLATMDDEAALKALRKQLALKVYARTSAYDGAISAWLGAQAGFAKEGDSGAFPEVLNLSYKKAQALRYGENPHQRAALYGDFFQYFTQLHGKELSYNNILDITAAAYLISDFEKPTVAILKHTNPCGVASDENLLAAWNQAFETDKQAPFGGIIVANRTMPADLAEAIAGIFCEVIIASDFSPEAMDILSKKKNLRLMTMQGDIRTSNLRDLRAVVGGLLAQDRDCKGASADEVAQFKVVSKRQPTQAEWDALLFGWRVVKHVKSNAIVYAAAERTLGVGAGQMSRVDSSRIAVWKAGEAGLSLKGSVIASDAFFPFADGLVAAAEAGASAAIQPGGSVRDAEVIAAADANNMAMVFTSIRHFRH